MPWIRIINPEAEFRTLSIRENLTDEDLAAQQFRCPKSNEHVARINFTPASAFQFFTDGVPQKFFGGFGSNFKEKIGVVVRRTSPSRNVIFRKSQTEEVSDSIFKEPRSEDSFRSACESCNFIETSEQNVVRLVKESWEELSKQHQQYEKECKEEGLEPQKARLNWTEGLFRYKFSDIDGVLIQNHKTSIRNGYAFAKVVEEVTGKKTDFYSWRDDRSKLIKIDRQMVRDALGFESKEPSGPRIVIDGATQAKIDDYKSCLKQLQKGGR